MSKPGIGARSAERIAFHLLKQSPDELAIHPDAHIVTSLPRSGTVRAARLLAEIGDAGGRFPSRNRWLA